MIPLPLKMTSLGNLILVDSVNSRMNIIDEQNDTHDIIHNEFNNRGIL